jgi:hypothetical protein
MVVGISLKLYDVYEKTCNVAVVNWLKYLEFITRIRNTVYKSILTITELMKQQRRIYNQCAKAESIIMKAQGELKGECGQKPRGRPSHSDQTVLVIVRQGGWSAWAVAKGKPRGTTGWSPLWSDGSWVVRQGRQDCVSSSQKTLKKSPKLQGDYRAQVHSGQMVLVV